MAEVYTEDEPVMNVLSEKARLQCCRDQVAAAKELYSPIKEWQTRLLLLRPGTPSDEELVCEVAKIDLVAIEGAVIHNDQERIQYEALSYTWGVPIFNHTLLCNDIRYPITSNLHLALRKLRHEKNVRALWVDAVCINQHDTAERNAQVRLMFLIFKKAMRVVAWLGEGDKSTDLCFDIMNHVEEHTYSKGRQKHPRRDSDTRRHIRDHIGDFKRLLDREWFKRTWIRQEIFAASDTIVQCGSKRIEWNKFRDVAAALEDRSKAVIPYESQSFHSIVNLLNPLPRWRRAVFSTHWDDAVEDEPRYKLLKLLLRSCHFHEADPKDKVYAVLGMAGTTDLGVDYHKTTSEVYESTMRYLVRKIGDPTPLLFHLPVTLDDSHFPSWVMDWRRPLHDHHAIEAFLDDDGSEVPAYVPDYRKSIAESDLPGQLSVKGREVARIIGVHSLNCGILRAEKCAPFNPSKDVRRLCVAKKYDSWRDPCPIDPRHGCEACRLRTVLLVPAGAAEGDIIIQPLGSYLHLVVRQSVDQYFKYLGPAFVKGDGHPPSGYARYHSCALREDAVGHLLMRDRRAPSPDWDEYIEHSRAEETFILI